MSRRLLSLSPIVVFLAVYLLSSIAAGDFYRIPVSSAFLIACIWSFIISRGGIDEKILAFSEGAGHRNVLMMIWIFILAGAFASTAKSIGAVDVTVAMMLRIVPPSMLFAGLFLTACFISIAIGTSVGTVVALVPIGAGIAAKCGLDTGFLTAIIVGGAFFGDNLSFISDTTIAATQAAGCRMDEKFKANIKIVIPAVLIVIALYVVMGRSVPDVPQFEIDGWYKIIPYLLIIGLSLYGLNVTMVLALGLAVNTVIGLASSSFTWIGLLESAGSGIAGMSDLIIVTLLAGGLLEMIRRGGGLDYIIDRLSAHINGPRGAQGAMALIVCLANICTANNTIAIITTGGISSELATKFGIAPRKVASLMDTFSCFTQGLLPYGAQLLMASGLASISSLDIIPNLYYSFVLGAVAVLSIIVAPLK